MRKWFLTVSVIGAMSVTGTALGQDDQQTTSYDFEDDLVSGDLMRPEGETLTVRRRGQRESLIQIRENFIPEMLKSVEDL